jgi:large subunit ribosomal protein L25
MKLTIATRSAKKSETKKLRREGKIPAVLYSKGEKGKEIVIDAVDFKKILNTTPTGTLSSKVFSLDGLGGKALKAIVKDIQYNITTYEVIHLDFEELHDDVPVTLNIPLVCINTVDCIGVKLGGVIRQVIRQVKVSCLPKDIPQQFELDVRDMNLGQSKKLSALEIPKGVRAAINLNEAAVVIARK